MDIERVIEKQKMDAEEENVVIKNTKEVNLDKEIRKYAKKLREENKEKDMKELEKQIEIENSPPTDLYTEQYMDNVIELSFELEVEDD